jgi:hypothetical protein
MAPAPRNVIRVARLIAKMVYTVYDDDSLMTITPMLRGCPDIERAVIVEE